MRANRGLGLGTFGISIFVIALIANCGGSTSDNNTTGNDSKADSGKDSGGVAAIDANNGGAVDEDAPSDVPPNPLAGLDAGGIQTCMSECIPTKCQAESDACNADPTCAPYLAQLTAESGTPSVGALTAAFSVPSVKTFACSCLLPKCGTCLGALASQAGGFLNCPATPSGDAGPKPSEAGAGDAAHD